MRIVLPVDLCNRQELRVRAEDEVDAGAAPLQFARCAVASFELIPLPAALSLGKWKGHKRGPSRSGPVRLDPEESSRRPHPHGLVPANCGHPPATPVAVDGTNLTPRPVGPVTGLGRRPTLGLKQRRTSASMGALRPRPANQFRLTCDCDGTLSRRSTVRKELDSGPWPTANPRPVTAVADSSVACGRRLTHCLCILFGLLMTHGCPGLGGQFRTKGGTSRPTWPHMLPRRDHGTSLHPIDPT